MYIAPAPDVYRGITLPYDDTYKFEFAADNLANWYVDGAAIFLSNNNYNGAPSVANVSLTAGPRVFRFTCLNDEGNWNINPAGWAGRVTDSSNNTIWTTRDACA
jgi:hypothetical protein